MNNPFNPIKPNNPFNPVSPVTIGNGYVSPQNFQPTTIPTVSSLNPVPSTPLPTTGGQTTPQIVKPGTPDIVSSVVNSVLPGVAPLVKSVATGSIKPEAQYVSNKINENQPQPGDTPEVIRQKQLANASNLVLGTFGGGAEEDLAKNAADEWARQQGVKSAATVTEESVAQKEAYLQVLKDHVDAHPLNQNIAKDRLLFNPKEGGVMELGDVKSPKVAQYIQDRMAEAGYTDPAKFKADYEDLQNTKQQIKDLKAEIKTAKVTAPAENTAPVESRTTLPAESGSEATPAQTGLQTPEKPLFPTTENNVPLPHDTTNKVEFNVTGDTEQAKVKSVVANSEYARNLLSTTGKDAYTAGQGLSPADLKLAEGYDQGISIPDLAKQAENPLKFKAFMTKLANYYDLRLAADRAAGGSTGYVSSYIPHEWDLSKPADLEKFNTIARQKGIQPYDGFRSQPRVFGTYGEGEYYGFKRANPNILEDLKSDYQKASAAISKQVLREGLKTAAPEKVTLSGFGRTDKGKPFINSNIRGLGGMSYAPEISDQLKGFESLTNKDFINMAKENTTGQGFKSFLKELPKTSKEAGLTGTIGTLYDHANQSLKHIILNLSGFHSINVSASFAGASLFDHPIKGLKGLTLSVPSFFSEGVTQKVIDSYKNKMIPGSDMSVFDAGLKAGVDLDRSLPSKTLNPLKSLSKGIFDRELYTLKLNLVDQKFGDGKINPDSPKGRAFGNEINLVMGEMNDKLNNMNPNTQKWLTRGLLAPGFTESKYTVLGHALSKGKDEAGNFARSAVIGKSIIIGTLATLGTVLATGNFPNLHQLLLNYTTNPSSQTNLRNKKGEKLDIGYPKTFIDEPLSLIQDPGAYVRSRFAPALTDIYEAAPPSVLGTGKNYYGAPTVNPKSKTPAVVQTIGNTIANDLPIGLQNLINYAGGSQTGPQSAIGIFGLSTHVHPKTVAPAGASSNPFNPR